MSLDEKKNGQGKRAKYLDKKNMWPVDQMKNREGKGRSIWRRKIWVFAEENKN